jgi:hypothetical protein
LLVGITSVSRGAKQPGPKGAGCFAVPAQF